MQLSIAPMIDWTYSHFRVWMRLLAPYSWLYTEMQTTGAITNNPQRALSYNNIEHPLVLQLGGADPHALVESAIKAESMGYDEINLNLGCPSNKVQAGRFGACLMKEPEHVAKCIRALKNSINIPVTTKTRIGVDEEDSYAFFRDFTLRLVDAGSDKIIVHARKAWLRGLNPKQNRTIPPINYDFVYRIKQEIKHLPVIINGDIKKLSEIQNHLEYVDGVMLGRLACDNPYAVASIHQGLYPDTSLPSRSLLFNKYVEYMHLANTKGVPVALLTKPIFNLAHGLKGSGQWKQMLMTVNQTKDLALIPELLNYLTEIENVIE